MVKDRCLIFSVYIVDLVLSTVTELDSGGDDVIDWDWGNDDDIFGSNATAGIESGMDTLVRCLGGLWAASRLLFGNTVRILLTFDVTGSI